MVDKFAYTREKAIELLNAIVQGNESEEGIDDVIVPTELFQEAYSFLVNNKLLNPPVTDV